MKINKLITAVLSLLLIFSSTSVSVFAKQTSTTYSATLAKSANAKWSGYGSKNPVKIKSTVSKSVYVKPTKSNFYVDSVKASPASNIKFKFNSKTGEVYISKIRGNVELTALTKEKTVPSKISIDYKIVEAGGFPVIPEDVRVDFSLKVTDKNENNASFANVYVDYGLGYRTLKTDENGIATFKETFPVGSYTIKANLTSKKSEAIASIPLNVKKQSAPVVDDRNIVNTTGANKKDGAYINADENLEYFTYPLSGGDYFVFGNDFGKWQSAQNNSFSSLGEGVYALRYKQYEDRNTNTIYLFSKYNKFEIERGKYVASIDSKNSQNVNFEKTFAYASQNDTVYIKATAESAYKISGVKVNYPYYIRDAYYDESTNTIVVVGVTRNLKITVNTEKQ